MHVKDEIKSTQAGDLHDGYESTILGKGILGIKEIINEAKKTGGTKHFIIEQESYQNDTPLNCAKEDLKAIHHWGF
jgi:hypothetical protein